MGEPIVSSCVDIEACLREDLAGLRARLNRLRADAANSGRQELDAFSSLFVAHTRAEEEVLLARALEIEETRVAAMEALEEHELAELLLDRVRNAADANQLEARWNVLGDLLEHHFEKGENTLYPRLQALLPPEEREELGMRYRETKERNELAPVFQMPVRESLLESQSGRIGYIIAWLLGVPAWILLLVFLIRGH
jgi:hypothetical protein